MPDQACSTTSHVRVILCMTIGNVVARDLADSLTAVLPHVDGYVLDCGAAPAEHLGLIEKIAAESKRQGCIVGAADSPDEHGANLFARVQRWGDEHGYSPEDTYLLWLGTSQVVHVEPGFDRTRLAAQAYELRHETASSRYHRPCLGRLSAPWQQLGQTDEWEPLAICSGAERLESIWIEVGEPLPPRRDELELRVRSLQSIGHAHAANARSLYHLAEALYSLNEWPRAADCYARLRDVTAASELNWFACLRQASCLLQSGQTDQGVALLATAYQQRPDRAEPLYALAQHFRAQGDMQRAFSFARLGVELPMPRIHASYVTKSVYDWQLREELMLTAYYVGEFELGLWACEELLARRDLSQTFQQYVAANETYYLAPLNALKHGNIRLPDRIYRHESVDYVGTNPTAVAHGGEIVVNVRLVNYRQQDGRFYLSNASDGIIRTRNVSFACNSVLGDWYGERESSVRFPSNWQFDVGVLGLEDMRWVAHNGRIWFTATCCQVPERRGMPQVVLGRMSADLSSVEHLVALNYEGASEVEKNWIPWSRGGTLYLIYSYDPFIVLHVDPTSGLATPVFCSLPPWAASRFRGATPPVKIPGSPNWVALVHEVAQTPAGRVYSHRFVELGGDFQLVGRSRPFCFDHRGIEYAAGLCSLDPGRLLITYGWEDREARWVEVDWRWVIRALRGTESNDIAASGIGRRQPFGNGGDRNMSLYPIKENTCAHQTNT